MKCVHANAYPCWAANCPFMSGCSSDYFCNQGPTRAPTAPKIMTNMRNTIEEAQEATPILCQAISPVVFHPDTPEFSPRVLLRRDKWPDLPVRTDTTNAALALTKTAASDPNTPAAVGIRKVPQEKWGPP